MYCCKAWSPIWLFLVSLRWLCNGCVSEFLCDRMGNRHSNEEVILLWVFCLVDRRKRIMGADCKDGHTNGHKGDKRPSATEV